MGRSVIPIFKTLLHLLIQKIGAGHRLAFGRICKVVGAGMLLVTLPWVSLKIVQIFCISFLFKELCSKTEMSVNVLHQKQLPSKTLNPAGEKLISEKIQKTKQNRTRGSNVFMIDQFFNEISSVYSLS